MDAGGPGAARDLEVTHTEDETAPAVTLAAACDGRAVGLHRADQRHGQPTTAAATSGSRSRSTTPASTARRCSPAPSSSTGTRAVRRRPAHDEGDRHRPVGNERSSSALDGRQQGADDPDRRAGLAGVRDVNMGFQPKADGVRRGAPGAAVHRRRPGRRHRPRPVLLQLGHDRVANGPHTLEARCSGRATRAAGHVDRDRDGRATRRRRRPPGSWPPTASTRRAGRRSPTARRTAHRHDLGGHTVHEPASSAARCRSTASTTSSRSRTRTRST